MRRPHSVWSRSTEAPLRRKKSGGLSTPAIPRWVATKAMDKRTEHEIRIENAQKTALLWHERVFVPKKCAQSLNRFVKEAWNIVEPGVTFVDGWHIGAITEHLQAVENREIRNLIINISPRSSKSSLCSVMFPAWVWIDNPHERFLFASYDLGLSMRDSRKCRALIGSAWYQRNWEDRYKILTNKGGQDTKK